MKYSNSENTDILKDKILSSHNAVLITHTNPDGDAIGSLTAMYRYFTLKGKVAQAITPNIHPEYLDFLNPEKTILPYTQNSDKVARLIKESDLIICLDFNQLKRTEGLQKLIESSNAYKVLIDHHPSPETEAFDVIFSEIERSSTCELLYRILLKMENSESFINSQLKLDIAESLYTGLMTDTNNYANSVRPATLRMAADLIEAGINQEDLQHRVFGVFSENRMRLMGHALLNKMKILPEFHAAYIVLDKNDLEQYGFKEGDTEGFVNLPLNIKGINISALFTESSEFIRVSLRSVNDFSVNKLSRNYFNGGGHERAAGGRLFFEIEKAGNYFEEKLAEFYHLESNKA